MHIAFLLPDSVKHSAYGVADAAEKEKNNAALPHQRKQLRKYGQNTPAERYIEDHSEYLVFLKIDGGQRDSERCKTPYDSEISPAESRVIFSERTKCDRRIRSRYKKEYRTVIEDTKYFFSLELR